MTKIEIGKGMCRNIIPIPAFRERQPVGAKADGQKVLRRTIHVYEIQLGDAINRFGCFSHQTREINKKLVQASHQLKAKR